MSYLCIPLRRRRLFLEVFGLFSGLFIVCCWAGFSGKKKLKINLRVREKLLTFAVPNETGLIRTCGAMLRGIERGSVVAGFAPCCGTSAEARAEAGKFLKDIDIHVA